eukprot:TRINITY_DN5225_c0_g1_i2.p1 TRINITY_DN5225_c0_g1~~TRINITY_DN5225_c0_g1_i2.p1  ORF type:complete len:283 (+),score=38.90 TRINITY_DN5225_c0_g1_i2:239-1087(+)
MMPHPAHPPEWLARRGLRAGPPEKFEHVTERAVAKDEWIRNELEVLCNVLQPGSTDCTVPAADSPEQLARLKGIVKAIQAARDTDTLREAMAWRMGRREEQAWRVASGAELRELREAVHSCCSQTVEAICGRVDAAEREICAEVHGLRDELRQALFQHQDSQLSPYERPPPLLLSSHPRPHPDPHPHPAWGMTAREHWHPQLLAGRMKASDDRHSPHIGCTGSPVTTGPFLEPWRAPPAGLPHHRKQTSSNTLSLIHISEPTRLLSISYAVFCLKKKKKKIK